MKKVLLAECDKQQRESHIKLINSLGHQVSFATTGDEVLAKVLQDRPDLLILDLEIGGMNGRTVLIELNKKNIIFPVIVMSDKIGMKEDPEIKLYPGLRHFSLKPIFTDELMLFAESILGKTQSNEAPIDVLFRNRLSRYTNAEHLEGGNNGEIYKAFYGSQPVIIKVFTITQSLDAESLARFRREAKLLDRVKHPNIIGLIEMGYDENTGIDFIVMQYFAGQDLEKFLKKYQYIPYMEAVAIAKQIAEGMRAAHAIGLIHRDLKPSNVLYDRAQSLVRIIDLGIAKELHFGEQITKQGHVVGTPMYMSPEQCQALPLDHRTDIYSLGVTLYDMLTGFPPFQGGSSLEIMRAHVHDPVVWSEEAQEAIPKKLRNIVAKMLEKNPQNRHQNMREVRNVLEDFEIEVYSSQR